ncbi:MAG: hypothetical protein JW795_11080 [Chitinivibrionales bacterium]|nr:hypothetical protein [Chitinivibrionales bacterium]
MSRQRVMNQGYHATYQILLLFFMVLPLRIHSKETLYVFFPTTMNAALVEQKLALLCPGVTIKVFETYSQFMGKIRMEVPDAVMVKPNILRQLSGFTGKKIGFHNESSSESYVLVTRGQKIDRSAITEKTKIGIIDFLGRAGMAEFFKPFFAAQPMLVRVVKLEDLLPLLRFAMADALIVSTAHIDYLKENSTLSLTQTTLPNVPGGIAVLGVRNGAETPKILEFFTKTYKNNPLFIEIDQWK